MPSAKTKVVEHLFFSNFDKKTGRLRKSIMTKEDVKKAIEHCNRETGSTLSTDNPANFMKDIIRGQGASRIWPDSLKKLRFTAEQRMGEQMIFEFVRYRDDQMEPFPDAFLPDEHATTIRVQSLSMPLESKALGRQDEAWLIQTAVNLRVVETHFALTSPNEVVQLTHLQMSVKLRKTEIDALFLARCIDETGREQFNVIITCEAKQGRDRILEKQILAQVKAVFHSTPNADYKYVIPLAMRTIPKRDGIYVVEFDKVGRTELNQIVDLVKVADAIYVLTPPVEGIGNRSTPDRTKTKKTDSSKSSRRKR